VNDHSSARGVRVLRNIQGELPMDCRGPDPLAAFIFAGHARTLVLESVHSSLLSAVTSFSSRAYSFFLLSADDQGSTKGHAPVTVDEDDVRAAVAHFKPNAVLKYEHADASRPIIPTACILNGTAHNGKVGDYALRQSGQSWLLAWWQTWHRLHRALDMVLAYEAEHALTFNWVVKLRPDAWFYAPGPSHCEIERAARRHSSHVGTSSSMRAVVTPAGVAGCVAPCVNDHLAWIPREHAVDFFAATSELDRCRGTDFFNRMRDYGHFLHSYLTRQRACLSSAPIETPLCALTRVCPLKGGSRMVNRWITCPIGARFVSPFADVPLADVLFVPYTIVRPCANFSDDRSAYADCSRVATIKSLGSGHPGIAKVPNLESRSKESFQRCLSSWSPWPPRHFCGWQ
jgi:hypothetical protein